MSLRAENLLDFRKFLSKLYFQNSTHSHILFHCILIDHGPTIGPAAPMGGDCRHGGLNTPESYL